LQSFKPLNKTKGKEKSLLGKNWLPATTEFKSYCLWLEFGESFMEQTKLARRDFFNQEEE
jgi:hypothetical protein